MTAAAPVLQAFFTERLAAARRASPHTIIAYRDAIRMLVVFAAARHRVAPHRLDIADLDAATIAAFLDHLEHQRGNSIRTRNARLAAIHALFAFAAPGHPEHAADIARVLAIPAKRHDQTIVTFLTEPEAQALIDAPDPSRRTGRRDRALLTLAIQTGLRAGELTALRNRDLHLGTGAHVACHGKGRKDRITPLTGNTAAMLKQWLAERGGTPDDPLFPTNRGTPLSHDALCRRTCCSAERGTDERAEWVCTGSACVGLVGVAVFVDGVLESVGFQGGDGGVGLRGGFEAEVLVEGVGDGLVAVVEELLDLSQ